MSDYKERLELNAVRMTLENGTDHLQEFCHGLAREAGWWDNSDLDDPQTIPTCPCRG